MISAFSVVGILTVIGALVLAVSNLRSHRLGFERIAWMALAWLVIILALVFIVRLFGA